MKKIIKLIVLVIAVVAIIGTSAITEFLQDHGIEVPSKPTSVFSETETEVSTILEGPYAVKRVVDGDTLVITINGADEKVRMIGINTPESVHSNDNKNTEEGKIASDYTKSILTGTSVYLEYDKDKYDDYDRILAYVYTAEDEMYNLHLIEEGYAQVMTVAPNDKYEMTFSQAEAKAKNNNVGFWANVWNDDNY